MERLETLRVQYRGVVEKVPISEILYLESNPKSVIILKDDFKSKEDVVQHELEEMCMKAFSQRDIPYYYEFRDEFPYTMNGKVDYKALENEGVGQTKVAAGAVF